MDYLAIDIGSGLVKLGLVTEEGKVKARSEATVDFDGYRTPIIQTVLSATTIFLSEHKDDFEELEGVGVSATGQIDSARGVVAGTCGNLPGWEGTRIREELESALKRPVTVTNNANCMCLGEAWVGVAKGYTDVVGVTLGNGVGGGIITGGRLLEGARGLAGELGHVRLHAIDGETCSCGAAGCFERYASASALVRAAKAVDPAFHDVHAVFNAARSGDARAKKQLAEWIEQMAQGIAGLVHIFNPQMVVIGGGASAYRELLIGPLSRKIMKSIMPAFADGLKILPAALEGDAGMVGAVRYFRMKNGEGPNGVS